MTEPCTDPASDLITEVMNVMRFVFGTESPCPPIGGAAKEVRFFVGDAAPLGEIDCGSPVVWVRLDSRYRSEQFPEQSPMVPPCGGLEVIALELGLARCAGLDESRSGQDREAEIAVDDTWHMSRAACLISAQLKADHHVGIETIAPYGPEGGLIVWSTTIYISV